VTLLACLLLLAPTLFAASIYLVAINNRISIFQERPWILYWISAENSIRVKATLLTDYFL